MKELLRYVARHVLLVSITIQRNQIRSTDFLVSHSQLHDCVQGHPPQPKDFFPPSLRILEA